EHSFATDRTNKILTRKLPDSWSVRCQNPVRLGPEDVAGAGSEPQPDVAVARGPDTLYAHRFPGPEDIRLLVEVADSSLAADRTYKAELYAWASIPLYWIINLVERQLEVFSDPDPAAGRYRSQQILPEDQQVTLSWEGLAPIVFLVREFLP